MEFNFDCSYFLGCGQNGMAVINSTHRPFMKYEHLFYIDLIINSLGKLSCGQRHLKNQTTSSELFFKKQNETMIIKANQRKVFGFIRYGHQDVYLSDSNQELMKVKNLLIVFDFYVHTTNQKRGIGKELFDKLLEINHITAGDIAYDMLNEKMINFLYKHYSLKNPLRQHNHLYIFPSLLFNLERTGKNPNIKDYGVNNMMNYGKYIMDTPNNTQNNQHGFKIYRNKENLNKFHTLNTDEESMDFNNKSNDYNRKYISNPFYIGTEDKRETYKNNYDDRNQRYIDNHCNYNNRYYDGYIPNSPKYKSNDTILRNIYPSKSFKINNRLQYNKSWDYGNGNLSPNNFEIRTPSKYYTPYEENLIPSIRSNNLKKFQNYYLINEPGLEGYHRFGNEFSNTKIGDEVSYTR